MTLQTYTSIVSQILTDCMSGEQIEAARAKIKACWRAGKTTQQAYQQIAWG